MFFAIVVTIVIIQRLFELRLAKHNERFLKKQGGYEVGHNHYKLIVMLHICFFLCLISEVVMFEKELLSFWYVPFFFFVVAQVFRVWSIFSLGVFWNTKIIVVPGAKVVQKGPYQWMRHPNYVIVIIEMMMLPMMFQAYMTLVLFSILNFILLSIRIRVEERALKEVTNYQEAFSKKARFIPVVKKQ